MLEHVPQWLGALLKNMRAGHAKLAIVQDEVDVQPPFLELSSPAFADGARLPVRFTADGEGVSPPLVWRGVPEGTASLALLVEDADAPTRNPLVHALVWNLPSMRRASRKAPSLLTATARVTGGMSGAIAFWVKAGCRPIRRAVTGATTTCSSSSLSKRRQKSCRIRAAASS